jgi:hypothetical protein
LAKFTVLQEMDMGLASHPFKREREIYTAGHRRPLSGR